MPSITLLRSTAVVVLAVAALVPAVTPAHAAATPAIPTFSPAIDPYARYEAESGCSPTEKPGPQMLRSILTKTYGTSISTNIVRPCSASSSGHEEGRSLDWTTSVRVAAQKEMATAFIGWLLAKDGYGSTHAMVRRLGIQYVIWNNRMWRAYDPGRGWAEYSGCLATAKAGKAYDNACHRNHVHVSFSWDGAYKRTSYATGYVACPSFPSVPTPAALPTTGLDYVPVTPARLLGTNTGSGSAYGACRVRAATRFDVPVLGRGGVPTGGVAAVVLRVGIYKPDRATSVRVWPTGAPIPRNPVAAARPGQAGALVTVPVGVDGKVSLQHAAGMTHLTADVVGYYRSPGGAGTRLHPLGAQRVLASRTVAAGGSVALDLAAASGVTDVRAGVLSVTATAPAASGGVSARVPGTTDSSYGRLKFTAGRTVTGTLVAQSGTDGVTALRNTSSSPVVLTVDLHAVYAAASVAGGRQFVPLAQARLVDTRTDLGIVDAMTAARTATFQVAGRGGVPTTGAAAVVLSGMALNPSAATSTTAWPEGATRPSVTQLSPAAAEPGGDLFLVPPGQTGRVAVRNASGTTDMTFDVVGFFR